MWHRPVSRSFSKLSEDGTVYPYKNKNITKLEEDFILGETLGRGAFGQILKATRKSDNHDCAIKIIKFDSNIEDASKTRREAGMLARLNHINIVRYFNSWTETATIPAGEYRSLTSDSDESLSEEICKLSDQGYINNADVEDEYEDDVDDNFRFDEEDRETDNSVSFRADLNEFKEVKYLCIQMELCEKRTLRTAIDNNLYLDEVKLVKYFTEICEGLMHIHENNIAHRDLKPENIFLTSNDIIKIGDFGLSKQISPECQYELGAFELPCGSLTAVCGTSVYIAPELHTRKSFNTKADIYSLGVTYYEMCSRTMTEMEKIETFHPFLEKRMKSVNFTTNGSKKKFLIRSLLHQDDNERPSCKDILKIFNSQKSIDELKEFMKQNRKVPPQQYNTFQRRLKATTVRRVDLTNFFLKAASKVFELHGARNIPMPTFLPNFSSFNHHFTTLLNTRGTSVSVANTTRIAFAHYVAKDNINKIRRYSMGRVFEEGYFSPTEIQECIFEAVSPELRDYVNDAEVLYITKEICDSIFANGETEICVFINHSKIFSTLLKHYNIFGEQAKLFTNLMIKLSSKSSTQIQSQLINLKGSKVGTLIQEMGQNWNIVNAEKDICAKINAKYPHMRNAFQELRTIAQNANTFGIKSENIFVCPLLLHEKYFSRLTFHVERKNDHVVIATGGAFESLIRRCIGGQKVKQFAPVSAVDISFNVENIIKLLSTHIKSAEIIDVLVVTQKKALAIPVLKELLTMGIKCEVVKEIDHSDKFIKPPRIVIHLLEEYSGIMYRVHGDNTPWNMIPIFKGNIKDFDLKTVISTTFSYNLYNQLK